MSFEKKFELSSIVTDKQNRVHSQDFIETVQAEPNVTPVDNILSWYPGLTPEEVKSLIHIAKEGYRRQVEEFETEFGNCNPEYNLWAKNQISEELIVVLPQPMLIKLLQRRADLADINQEYLDKISDSTIAFFGTSTGSHPFMQLVRMGLKAAHVFDVKTWKLSNLNRSAHGTVADINVHKPINLVSQALMINPYFKVTIYPQLEVDDKLDVETIDIVIKTSDLAIEMTDDFKLKALIPTVCVDNNKPCVCPDNFGIDPSVRVYTHRDDLPQFPKKLNLKGFIEIVGKDYISLSLMLNAILRNEGKLGFIAQHGPTAAVTGGIAVVAISRLLLGEKVKSHIYVPLSEHVLTIKSKKDEYLRLETRMRREHPEIFNQKKPSGKLIPLAEVVDEYILKKTGIVTNYFDKIWQISHSD